MKMTTTTFATAAMTLLLTTGCAVKLPETPEEHATYVYNQMASIEKAAQKYKKDHGLFPQARSKEAESMLTEGGYIEKFPQPLDVIFGPEGNQSGYRYDSAYDRMDDNPVPDTAIAVWGLRDEICRMFNALYASNGSGPTIFDYQANGNRYPGTAIGTDMRLYAIKWKSDAIDDCEINWVIQYNE